MKTEASLNSIYAPSDDIVAREIEGELIIVPLVADIGDMQNELYSMNKSGKNIWHMLNGKDTLKEVVEKLRNEFESSEGEIEKDVIGLVSELLKRAIVVEI